MSIERPIALSVAGFDPSAGAGILADIKTFEQHKVRGFGVCSALTCQNDSEFVSLRWVDKEEIMAQLDPLINKFVISSVKIGIFRDLESVKEVIVKIKKQYPEAKIVLDPVLKATAGFHFHNSFNPSLLKQILKEVTIITPNFNEISVLEKILGDRLSKYTGVLLKGGHNPISMGIDILYQNNQAFEIPAGVTQISQKHGSGCVLSSAIAARLAQGYTLLEACRLSKTYTETFLNSNSSLLGYHNL